MKQEIDENLYSRQLYVLGTDAMTALQKSHVLVIGLTGLGQEIAKNIILAGINKVTLYDPFLVETCDLSAGFYFSYDDIGKRRDFSVLHKMKELNPYVDVDVLNVTMEIYSDEFVNFINDSTYTLVVTAQFGYDLQKRIHKAIVGCQISGLISQVFCDFKEFIVKDKTGEPCFTGIINDVDQSGVLTMIDGERHNLEDGMCVKVHKNNEDVHKEYHIRVIDIYRVQLLDFSDDQFLGGSFEEIKVPVNFTFKPLTEALKEPVILNDDPVSRIIHNCYFLFNNRFVNKASDFVKFYMKSIDELPYKLFSEELIRVFVYMQGLEIMPMVSIIGGFVAQEILKCCTSKFTPLLQFMYYDGLEVIRTEKKFKPIKSNVKKELCNQNIKINESSGQNKTSQEITDDEKISSVEILKYDFIQDYIEDPTEGIEDDRYSPYVKLFGHSNFDKIKKSCGFIVGAGAIGCEHLKNLVMSGVGLEGKIILTDMDSIEQSNLNRQFLFRQKDVGSMKSEVAIREVKNLNEDFSVKRRKTDDNLICHVQKLGVETESIFSDAFYTNLTFVANALDNIEARKYVDGRIITNKVPLFESGTLGTKGNTQVILPNKTESYSSSNDPPEKSIPLCTLRNFPHLIEHTIEFALSEFKNSFNDKIISIRDYLNKEEHESIKAENIGEEIESMVMSIPENTNDCLRNAFNLFYSHFYVAIKKLLNSFPANHITDQGVPFWSAPKRPPVVMEFDECDVQHKNFIFSTAMLYKAVFGVAGNIEMENVNEYFHNNKNDILKYANEKIDDVAKEQHYRGERFTEKEDISLFAKKVLATLTPQEFEKDSNTNYHVDFIHACANIRAQNYKIKTATRLQVKGIAGKIIPAIATTTAIVSGLSTLEIYKYIFKAPYESFRNTYLSLALPLIASSEPLKALKEKYYFNDPDKSTPFTLWDTIEVDDMTVQEFFNYIDKTYNSKVDMLLCDNKTLYMSFMKNDKQEKNLQKKFTEIVECDPGKRFIILNVIFASECETFPCIVVKVNNDK